MSERSIINNLIAHYLKENGYPQTLKQFEIENGKAIDSSIQNSNEESLESIIQDRLQYNSLNKQLDDMSLDTARELIPDKYKSLIQKEFTNWNSPYPHTPKFLPIHSLIISSAYHEETNKLYFATNDSHIIMNSGDELKKVKVQEIMKKVLVIETGVLLLGMSGNLYYKNFELENFEKEVVIQTQSRFTVDAKAIKFNDVQYIVTLSFNNILKLIKFENLKFEIIDEFKLDIQGSCFDLTLYQDQIVIVVGKVENTLLDVYTITDNKFKLKYKISINDAEFTTSSFSPRYITISNTSKDIPIIAVATSHDPYMRIILVSLSDFNSNIKISRNQILKNYNTLSPQDKFSQPLISWRYNNNKISGIWIMGDDGFIRGLDLLENKIIVELKDGGHKTKIKDFLNFYKDGKEVLITCGIDRQVIEWTE
ncbi:hypothetical protein KGF54_004400 [Candida jiufengensis]|uniref:uncharacterized protein n=1 Tax=Candida jiufengensis TaxID=497108 RepID=UPI002224E770|nr:uncharacterized protein KGF54_004400 [Candida jiufengensis]KAI5951326.1 hypothetical protein KGF54_004400 [Candida jiufengensis]